MPNFDESVFINCPFDDKYRPMFDAIVFAVHDCGFVPRSALEIDNATDNRLAKIVRLIGGCRYGIHDLSRTELSPANLPRFNMPLELGLFLGCKFYGARKRRQMNALIFDREPYRYRQFISDIAGQDVVAHQESTRQAIGHVRAWLRAALKGGTIPGGTAIYHRFELFKNDLPAICAENDITVDELTFLDYSDHVATWLSRRETE